MTKVDPGKGERFSRRAVDEQRPPRSEGTGAREGEREGERELARGESAEGRTVAPVATPQPVRKPGNN